MIDSLGPYVGANGLELTVNEIDKGLRIDDTERVEQRFVEGR